MSPENLALLKWLVQAPEAKFRRYHDGSLWYAIEWETRATKGIDQFFPDRHEFEFPVPISDIGTATFNAIEKGALMMRYIRKHLLMLKNARKEQG